MAAIAAKSTDANGATDNRMLVSTASDVLATRVTAAASATDLQRGRPPCQTMARETTVTLSTSAAATATNAAAHDRQPSTPAPPAMTRKTPTASTHSALKVTRFSATF